MIYTLKSGFLQLCQDQIPGVFKEYPRSHLLFSRSPILDWTRLYWDEKVYTIIGYNNINFIICDYCNTNWNEMCRFSAAQTNANCRRIKEFILDLSTFFFKDRLKVSGCQNLLFFTAFRACLSTTIFICKRKTMCNEKNWICKLGSKMAADSRKWWYYLKRSSKTSWIFAWNFQECFFIPRCMS